MRRAASQIVAVVLVWVVLAASWGAAQAQTTYKIGVMGGLFGLGAQIGEWTVQGARVGAETVNADTGPVRLEIIAEDMQWNPQKAVEAFNQLVNVDHVAAILSAAARRCRRSRRWPIRTRSCCSISARSRRP